MATEFIMPKLGLTMEEGTILQWLVPDGAEVTAGMPVMSIETDKVESDVEASASGRLRQLGQPGDTFTCGAVVGMLLAEGEEAPAPAAAAAPPAAAPAAVAAAPVAAIPGAVAPSSTDGRAFISPNARRVAAQRNVDLATVRGTGPNGRIVSEDVETAASRPAPAPRAAGISAAPRPAAVRPGGGSYPATAAARQLADLLGIDLAEVAPDENDGYVTRESVARYVRFRLQPAAAPTAAPAAAAAPPAATQTPTSVRKMTGMRGTIAKRMHASLQEMAQLTLTMDADMDAVVADRSARKAAGAAPGFTDYIVAAAARALVSHPHVNAQVTPDGIAVLPEIHVGLAVALDEGLMVPVVRNTDRLDLATLSAETTRLADAARGGTLKLGDLDGGTFSVSALGMFGVDAFTPVINPPNAAILGVGRLRDDIVLVDGTVATRKRLTLSLTWDHRVFDGAPAAAFCKSIVDLLADPAALDS
jgi:pyruvate dehydrogenase E2 component (dihydrolipoamide acetyltransferase)